MAFAPVGRVYVLMARKKLLVTLVVGLLALWAAGWWVGRAQFLRFALDQAVMASDGRLHYGQVSGSLFGDLHVDHLAWRDPETGAEPKGLIVELRDLRFAWQPWALLRRELDLTRLSVADVRVRPATSKQTSASPIHMPAEIVLPLGVRLRELTVDRLQVDLPDAAPIRLETLSLAATYQPGQLRIEKLDLASAFGRLSLTGQITDSAPYAMLIAGQFEASWRQLPVAALLAGNLDRLMVSVAASVPASVRVKTRDDAQAGVSSVSQPGLVAVRFPLFPFQDQLIGPVKLMVRDLDPAALGMETGLPMLLGGQADATLQLPREGSDLVLEGEIQIENSLAGVFAQQALPLRRVQSEVHWRDGILDLKQLQLQMPGEGRMRGALRIDTTQMRRLAQFNVPVMQAELAVADLDPGVFTSGLSGMRLDGRIGVAGTRAELELRDASMGGTTLAAAARLEGTHLLVEQAQLSGLPGITSARFDARGKLDLEVPHALQVTAGFSGLDPSRLGIMLARLKDRIVALEPLVADTGGPAPKPEVLAGSNASTGQVVTWQDMLVRLPGQLQGRVNFATKPVPSGPVRYELEIERLQGKLAGSTLAAQGRASLMGEGFSDARLQLSLDQARLKVQGGLGLAGERLKLEFRTDNLARLAALPGLEGFGGELNLQAVLSGKLHRPALELTASASRLSLPGQLQIGSLRISGSTPALETSGAGGQVKLSVQLDEIRRAGQHARRLTLELDGALADHRFKADLAAQQFGIRLAGRGGYSDRWRASITQMSSSGLLQARLLEPLSVLADADGIELSGAVVATDFARLQLARAAWRQGRFVLDTQLRMDRLGPLLQIGAPQTSAPVKARDDQVPAKDAAAVSLAEFRNFGLGLELQLEGSSTRDLNGRALAQLIAPAGLSAGGNASVNFVAGQMDGQLDVELPSLAFTDRLIGPEWLFDGSLRFAGKLTGTVGRPQVVGEVRGERLRLEQRAMGWRLGEGTLAGRFDGERFELESLHMLSLAKGGGDLRMKGTVQVESMQGRFDFNANRLVVPIGPGQRVVLSGQASAISRLGRFEIVGKLRADEGRIELAGGDAPKLPADVVIGGKDAQVAAIAETKGSGSQEADAPLVIDADLRLNLGDQLYVHGSGLDARLSGELQLKGTLPDAPRGFGTVRVRDGTFAAYGNELEITRGRIIFNGPLDNPVLDIVALRRDQAVEAGVSVNGTVLAPKIRLTSIPDVPDAEKLSWLVLGQGLEYAGGAAQIAALQAAAATLFASNDGSLGGSLRHSLGLDVLTVRSAGSAGGLTPQGFGDPVGFHGQMGRAPNTPASSAAADNVIAVGKKLSSKLLLSYEQSLQGTRSLLRLQYDLTRRLSLRAQTGTQTALDLLLRYPFD